MHSAWPVFPEQTARYVGLRVFPAMYPTAVADTLGNLQKPFSDPQKQPVAKQTLQRPAGSASSGETHAAGGSTPGTRKYAPRRT